MPDIIVAMIYIFGGIAVVASAVLIPTTLFLTRLSAITQLPRAEIYRGLPWTSRILKWIRPGHIASVFCPGCNSLMVSENGYSYSCSNCQPMVRIHVGGFDWTVTEEMAAKAFPEYPANKVDR